MARTTRFLLLGSFVVFSAALPFQGGPPVERQAVLDQAAGIINTVAQKALPAVVSITTIKKMSQEEAEGFPPGLSPFNMFGGPPDADAPPKRGVSVGSGVVIDNEGLVLTNHHVIENAERVTITFDEKHKSPGVVLGSDPKTDLALVRIKDLTQAPALTPLSFANSDQVKVGDWAIAVGSPFGLKQSVTVGVVSATGRAQMGVLDTEDFIQTDAAINPGSSGGPLLNSAGQIIGLNTAIFSQSGGFIGIGFAIPAKIAQQIAGELKQHGRVVRGWLGLAAQDVDANLASYFKAPGSNGALVTEVDPKGPAGTASLEPGDIITRYNRQSVDSADHLKSMVAKTTGGSEVRMALIRQGKEIAKTVKVREAPGPITEMAGQLPPAGQPRDPNLGLTVRDIIPELATYLHLPRQSGALIIGVQPGSPAFDAGIMPGDVVLKAGHDPVKGAKDFDRLVKKGGSNRVTVLYIQRGTSEQGEKLFVPV
ncbi:MAG TPA: trypsin-like peptidase domain-containing protein, partial [Bdellovibrionota bacterium]|nr:trypsin-like peptidase domain-containing protein [Bdellovibrionota bacterium]